MVQTVGEEAVRSGTAAAARNRNWGWGGGVLLAFHLHADGTLYHYMEGRCSYWYVNKISCVVCLCGEVNKDGVVDLYLSENRLNSLNFKKFWFTILNLAVRGWFFLITDYLRISIPCCWIKSEKILTVLLFLWNVLRFERLTYSSLYHEFEYEQIQQQLLCFSLWSISSAAAGSCEALPSCTTGLKTSRSDACLIEAFLLVQEIWSCSNGAQRFPGAGGERCCRGLCWLILFCTKKQCFLGE